MVTRLPPSPPIFPVLCGDARTLQKLSRKRRLRETTGSVMADDSLPLFLEESNPALVNVWRNALRAMEKLREDPLPAAVDMPACRGCSKTVRGLLQLLYTLVTAVLRAGLLTAVALVG